MKLKTNVTAPFGRAERAFTMVEIAISIAIVAFALVAILGVLPTGLNVQRDNREDTIVNQDASYILECLRSGEAGLSQFTSNVEMIQLTVIVTNGVGAIISSNTSFYSNNPPITVITPAQLIGFLTQPKLYPDHVLTPSAAGANASPQTNYITKIKVRSFSGPSGDMGITPNAKSFAFTYFLTPEILPFSAYDPTHTNFPYVLTGAILSNVPPFTPPALHSNAAVTIAQKVNTQFTNQIVNLLTTNEMLNFDNYMMARARENNLFEVRLKFEWPVYPDPSNPLMGRSGAGRQSFHTMVVGALVNDNGVQHFVPGVAQVPTALP